MSILMKKITLVSVKLSQNHKNFHSICYQKMHLFDSFQFLLEPFSYGFMRRALLAAALIGLTNGFLGTFIILRRQALIVDALSHSLLPGLAIASIIFGLTPQGLFIGGFIATLLVAFGGSFIARNSRLKVNFILLLHFK